MSFRKTGPPLWLVTLMVGLVLRLVPPPPFGVRWGVCVFFLNATFYLSLLL